MRDDTRKLASSRSRTAKDGKEEQNCDFLLVCRPLLHGVRDWWSVESFRSGRRLERLISCSSDWLHAVEGRRKDDSLVRKSG